MLKVHSLLISLLFLCFAQFTQANTKDLSKITLVEIPNNPLLQLNYYDLKGIYNFSDGKYCLRLSNYLTTSITTSPVEIYRLASLCQRFSVSTPYSLAELIDPKVRQLFREQVMFNLCLDRQKTRKYGRRPTDKCIPIIQNIIDSNEAAVIDPKVIPNNALYTQSQQELNNIYRTTEGAECIEFSMRKLGQVDVQNQFRDLNLQLSLCKQLAQMSPYTLAELIDPSAIALVEGS